MYQTTEPVMSSEDVNRPLWKKIAFEKQLESPIIMKLHSSVKIIKTTKLIPFHPDAKLMRFSSLYTYIKLLIPLVSTMHLSACLPRKSARLPPVLTQVSSPHCGLKSFPPDSCPLVSFTDIISNKFLAVVGLCVSFLDGLNEYSHGTC